MPKSGVRWVFIRNLVKSSHIMVAYELILFTVLVFRERMKQTESNEYSLFEFLTFVGESHNCTTILSGFGPKRRYIQHISVNQCIFFDEVEATSCRIPSIKSYSA